jgi:hypothetical protein
MSNGFVFNKIALRMSFQLFLRSEWFLCYCLQIYCVMKKLLLICIAFFSLILPCHSLTDLDYHLGKSKYGTALLSDEESFHGENSAMLSVQEDGNYIRVSVYFDEPLPIEDLDHLSMWMYPLAGNGNVQIEIFLDGDSDSSYNSKSSADARLRSAKESWSDINIEPGQWNELDGFDLSYEVYGEDGSGALDEQKQQLQGLGVVRLYITIYKDPSVEMTSIFVDYIKIGDQIISFEQLEKEDIKSGPATASPGGQITYTLTYGNNLQEPVDLVITEIYDSRTIFVSADPRPDAGTDNTWTIRQLQPGQHGQIVVKVRTNKFSCKADINGKASGTGFTSVKNFLSNDLESYEVTNTVRLSSSEFNATATVVTAVRPVAGSTLSHYHHGYGDYLSQGRLKYSSSSITFQQEMNAECSVVKVNTSSQAMVFNGRLYAQNAFYSPAREISMNEKYRYADNLSLGTNIRLSKSNTDLLSVSSFSGWAEIAQKWRDTSYMQHYVGSFSRDAEAHTRISRKSKSRGEESLECCFGSQGESP